MITIWWMALGHAAEQHVTVQWNVDGPQIVGTAAATLTVGHEHAPLIVVDAHGRPLATQPLRDPRHRSLIEPDGGGVSATLATAVERVAVPWPSNAHAVRLGPHTWRPTALTEPATSASPAGASPRPPPPLNALVPILQNGDPAERLDLVILGDGYAASELESFAVDVEEIVEYLLTLTPYSDYTGLFNIWRVDLPSGDSGVSQTDVDPPTSLDTAYGCFYGCAGIERLVCCDDMLVAETIDTLIPDADGVLVLVNDQRYGGSGGFNYATSFVGDEGPQVAAHELGHTLVGLWDEYSYGVSSTADDVGANCSPDPAGHWDHWLDKAAVDAFTECSFTDYVRPTDDRCLMRTLQDGYCPVCREQVVLEMYGHVPSLVRSVSPEPGTALSALQSDPPTPITVETLGPDDGLVHEWSIDGEVIHEDLPELDIRCSGLQGELTLRVYDDTSWVRADPQGLLEQTVGPWTVSSEDCAPPVELPPIASCGCGPVQPTVPLWLGLTSLVSRR